MDCNQARPLMAAHLAAGDSPEEWEALRHQLRCCPACRVEAEGLIETWHALVGLPEAEVPAGVWDRIQARLPARQPVPAAPRAFPWAAMAATAVAALLVFIAASWALPYEAAARLCREAFAPALPPGGPSDPAAFFLVGVLFGLLPLGVATLGGSRWLSGGGGGRGALAGLIFAGLALPYALVACADLPAALTAVMLAGMLAGALAGGPAGLWAGGKLLAPARP